MKADLLAMFATRTVQKSSMQLKTSLRYVLHTCLSCEALFIYQIYLTFYKKRYNPDLERLTLSIFDLKGLEVCC